MQCNFCPQYLQFESGQIGMLTKLTPEFVAADRWQQPAKEQKCVGRNVLLLFERNIPGKERNLGEAEMCYVHTTERDEMP